MLLVSGTRVSRSRRVSLHKKRLLCRSSPLLSRSLSFILSFRFYCTELFKYLLPFLCFFMASPMDDDFSSWIASCTLPQLSEVAGFPPQAVIRIPTVGVAVEDCPVHCVAFYKYPFYCARFKFPFALMARQFLERVGISPAQVMPQAWRIMAMVLRAAETLNVSFDWEDLLQHYEPRVVMGRVTLIQRHGKKSVASGVAGYDTNWRKEFFFVEKASLGEAGAWLLPGWPLFRKFSCPFCLTVF
jgi:hypothetical protein